MRKCNQFFFTPEIELRKSNFGSTIFTEWASLSSRPNSHHWPRREDDNRVTSHAIQAMKKTRQVRCWYKDMMTYEYKSNLLNLAFCLGLPFLKFRRGRHTRLAYARICLGLVPESDLLQWSQGGSRRHQTSRHQETQRYLSLMYPSICLSLPYYFP